MSADLSHIDVWLFDLDNTLYPPECGYMALMEEKMSAAVARLTGLEPDAAFMLQKQYLADHGTTLAGLMITHDVDPAAFLDEVHDLSTDCIAPNPELGAALDRLPGRKLVFTNGDEAHSVRVLQRLGIEDRFEDLFHIAAADYIPKPSPLTFARMMDRFSVTPAETVFFEDSPRNLKPAADLGITTVLVGPKALESDHAFVHHRTHDLTTFLNTALVKEPFR